MLNYKVFVINLARSPERLAAIASQLDAIGVPFERIDALDGKTLSDDFIEEVSPAQVVGKSYHRALSKAEVACSLSHKRAWQQVIDESRDAIIAAQALVKCGGAHWIVCRFPMSGLSGAPGRFPPSDHASEVEV